MKMKRWRTQNTKAALCVGLIAVMISGCAGKGLGLEKIAALNEETVTEESTEQIVSETPKEELQDEMLTEYAREKYMGECETVGYRDLMRYQDEYMGKKVYVEVFVAQISDGWYQGYSESGEEYVITDEREYDTTKILADDIIAVWGNYSGVTKVDRADGTQEELPEIIAKYIDIYDNGQTLDDYVSNTGNASENTSENTSPETEASAAPVSADYQTMYVVNCKESITLRTSPTTAAAEICQIPLGAPVSFVGNAGDGFYNIIYLGKTGYALASYLGYTAPDMTNTYKTMRVVNCNESITLRTSPSTAAAEICQIPLHAVVSYIEPAAKGFYKISYLGRDGYALASYLEFE